MPFSLLFTREARDQYQTLEAAPAKQIPFKAVRKALGLLSQDPNYPSLNTHPFHTLKGAEGEKVLECYAQNKTPGAWRIFFHYGPGIHPETRLPVITIVAITPHP